MKTTMTDQEIQDVYDKIKDHHKRYLARHGVLLPALRQKGQYTKDALVLVFLAQNYPETRTVSKKTLTEFIRNYDENVTDVQQARHLGAQKGWFILSGTRNDNASMSLRPGDYHLETMEEPYPGFTASRRGKSTDDDDWESLKKKYDFRCACCGSREGEPHRYWKKTITRLQKGHMDPRKPLGPGNIIPQCEKCNRPDRNYWVYDAKGRVVGIANAKIVDKCPRSLKQEIYERLACLFQKDNGRGKDRLGSKNQAE